LFNQGTAVVGWFNANVSSRGASEDTLTGFNAFYLTFNYTLGNITISVGAPAGGIIPILGSFGFTGDLPSPEFESEAEVRGAAGVFTVSVGDVCQYIQVGNIVLLRNITINQELRLFETGLNAQQSFRLYYNHPETPDDTTNIGTFDSNVLVVSLPPITQADIMQANPDAVQSLMKDHGGFYTANGVFEPIWGMTEANAYSKVVFSVPGFDVSKAINQNEGWHDSVDINFGITVSNMQSIPYAAAPLLKIMRDDQQVPSQNSLIGLYATACPPADDVSMMVAKAIKMALPHALPVTANGLGTLFGAVCQIMDKMPLAAAHTVNIANSISNVVNSVLAAVEWGPSANQHMVARAF